MTANDWRIIGATFFILAVAIYCKFVLGWSTKDFLVSFSKEFGHLATGKFTVEGINAATVLAVILLALAACIAPKFEKVLSLSGAIPTSGSTTPSIFATMLLVLVGGLVCVTLIRPKN